MTQQLLLRWSDSRVERHHLNGYHLDSVQINHLCWPLNGAKVDAGRADRQVIASSMHQSCAGLSVSLKREISFYVLAVYFPSGCFVQMALCNFLMPVAALNARLLCIFLPLACLTLLYGSLPAGIGYTLLHAWLFLCQLFVLLCFPYLALAALERAEQLVMQQSAPDASEDRRALKKSDKEVKRIGSELVTALPASLNVVLNEPVNISSPIASLAMSESHNPTPAEASSIAPTPQSEHRRSLMTNIGWRIRQPFRSWFARPTIKMEPIDQSPKAAQRQPSIEHVRWQKETEIVSFSTLKIDRKARFVMPALFYCCVMIYTLYVYTLHDDSNEAAGR